MKPILHQAIRIQLKPSRLMLALISVLSIICCWILLVLTIVPAIKFFGMWLVIVSSLYFILRDTLQMLPWSWQVLEINSKGQLVLNNQRGHQFQPALAEDTFIHARLTILNFKPTGNRLKLPPLILLGSQANKDELRRLRIWLRWAKQPSLPNQSQQS